MLVLSSLLSKSDNVTINWLVLQGAAWLSAINSAFGWNKINSVYLNPNTRSGANPIFLQSGALQRSKVQMEDRDVADAIKTQLKARNAPAMVALGVLSCVLIR